MPINELMTTATCFQAASLVSYDKIILSFVFFSLSILSLLIMKRYNLSTKSKIILVYSHLLFLFFPIFILTTNTACGMFCMSCYNNMPALVAYALPATAAATALTGFFFLPALFTLNGKKRLRNKYVKKLLRKYGFTKDIYTIDDAKPIAFSFRGFKSAIFISIGMQEILNKKELESVILHEIAHLRQHSSMLKLSGLIFRLFSPFYLLSGFNHENKQEEREADRFAVKLQRTDQYIKSAKKRVSEFYKHIDI